MSVSGFDHSYLHSPDSGKYLDLAAGLSVSGEVGHSVEELAGSAERANNVEIDSLHQIANEVAAGETLDMMSAGQTIGELRWAVPVHPTVSELIPTLLLGLAPAAKVG